MSKKKEDEQNEATRANPYSVHDQEWQQEPSGIVRLLELTARNYGLVQGAKRSVHR